jgi:hypothetical protein
MRNVPGIETPPPPPMVTPFKIAICMRSTVTVENILGIKFRQTQCYTIAIHWSLLLLQPSSIPSEIVYYTHSKTAIIWSYLL